MRNSTIHERKEARKGDGKLQVLIDCENFAVVVGGNILLILDEAPDMGWPIIVGSQGQSHIIKIEDQPRKVVDPHSDIEGRIEKGPVPAPFNSHLLSQKFPYLRHNLHQAFGTPRGDSPIIKLTFNGNDRHDEFWIMIVTNGLLIDDLRKLFFHR